MSRERVWAIFTASFVHTDASHLLGNLLGLAINTFLFVAVNLLVPSSERRKRSVFFVWTVFLSAVLANAVYIAALPGSGIGASGIVNSGLGVAAGFGLIHVLRFTTLRINLWTGKVAPDRGVDRWVALDALVGFWVFGTVFLEIVIVPGAFLGVGQNVNILVHAAGFYIAFLITLIPPLCRGVRAG